MEEIEISEIEHKDYLLRIQEDRILKLEKIIAKYDRFAEFSLLILLPLAGIGLLYLGEKWSLSIIETIEMILIIVSLLCLVALFGWSVEKLKNL